MSCTCGKVGFVSRRAARDAARRHMPVDTPTEYRCPDDSKLWHLSSAGKQGKRAYKRARQKRRPPGGGGVP